MTKIGTRILMSAIISMLVTALSGMGLSGTAKAATCVREGLPDVRVTVAMSPVHTNTTQTLAELSSRDNNTHLGIMDGHYVGGLTVGDIKAQSQIGFDSSVSFFTGNTCLWVQSLTVDLSLQSSIYIARELPRGSCEYRELLAHEQKHIKTDQTIVQEYRRLIEARLELALLQQGAVGPVPVTLAGDMQRDLTAQISRLIDAEMSALYAERDRRQQLLDTPQEYQRLSLACR